MKYVLDTNSVSLLMRGEPSVSSRLTSCARNDVLLPEPAIAEIEYGLARMPRSARQRRLRRRFVMLLAELGRVEWTDDVSLAFGEIKADLQRRGAPIEDLDVAIAAHAAATGATLVTDNVSDMRRIRGLLIENWLQGSR